MEEGELLGDGLLDEPALGVAAEQGGEAGLEVIGDQQGGTAGAVQDGNLADLAVVVAQRGGRFDDFKQAGAVRTGTRILLGGRDGLGGLDEVSAAADGDEADALLVEALEAGVGGEAAVEDEEAQLEAAGLGEVEEFEDGFGAGLAADRRSGAGGRSRDPGRGRRRSR